MLVQQLSVKIAAEETGPFDPEVLIGVFHRWIRDRRLPHRLLIDVADYRHVHEGPGVMVIANEAHFGLDAGGGRLGLLYGQKRDPLGAVAPKLREAFRDALAICRFLEEEPEVPLRFAGGDVELRVMSRLAVEQGEAAFAALEAPIASFARELYGDGAVQLEHLSDPREPFGVRISASGSAGVSVLLDRVGGPPHA